MRNPRISDVDVQRRRLIHSAAALAVAGAAAPLAFPAIAQSKPFNGVKLRGAAYQHGFFNILRKYIPEFEQQTGMTVDLQLSAFPVYNQQADLELSSGGSAWDFCNVTFILAARWVAAGLLTNLDDFTSDRKRTPASWNPEDFVKGAQLPYLDKSGRTYGYAWEGGAMLMGMSRTDLMKKRGVEAPRTFDELMKVCEAVHGQDGVTGFVSSNLHHWFLPPYVQGFGGDLFVNPPSDIKPALDSAASIEATQFYTTLLTKYSPQGVLGYTEDQARAALIGGRSNIFIHSSAWVTAMLTSPDSKVKETARVVRMPAGPKGDFPASNSQGFGIPKNAKNKDAAWEFIKWALSPELTARIVKETGHPSVCRRSVIESAEYKRTNTINGQDIGKLYLEVLEQPARTRNYMAYRTVKEFPLVGDAVNKAVERVVSGQMPAADSMKQAQEAAVASLRRAGAKV
ncbi:carbohydrate ABC transporter, N-acetylglucosamine/diacetylchitobiose-binding protein [Variovorax sp. PBL-H6]|uniref:ABC transporter substrate-binding protein n=1 Tax=Variovorax sp. PBL-H6 TaxID=434009 RepID=UPI001319A126|nr:extracellular solute-binding protein [Variovorax sp. PBL-H6]VTU38113.1 carbohydrate ABC transporter, N-acetylglucosamine/diacetylchitobiose-binding protein [Variovorax sp. PBL-H6]